VEAPCQGESRRFCPPFSIRPHLQEGRSLAGTEHPLLAGTSGRLGRNRGAISNFNGMVEMEMERVELNPKRPAAGQPAWDIPS
jgi:hypothetical protein